MRHVVTAIVCGVALGACSFQSFQVGDAFLPQDASDLGGDAILLDGDIVAPDVADASDVGDAPTCDAGFVSGDGGCVPARFRLIAPLSGTVVGSTTPTLRFDVPAGVATNVKANVCRLQTPTPSCAALGVTVVAPGMMTLTVPASMTLMPGTYSWSVDNGAGPRTPNGSATWYFTVLAAAPHIDVTDGGAPIGDLNAASWGMTLDVNGDGAADLAASAYATSMTGEVDLYVAPSLAGGTASPTTVVTNSTPVAHSSFGTQITAAGDLDGDGFGELAVSQPFGMGPPLPHGVVVFYGGPGGLDTAHPVFLMVPEPATTASPPQNTHYALSTAGDFDGDGYADLLVGTTSNTPSADCTNNGTGAAYVYFGGLNRVSDADRLTIPAPTTPVAGCFGVSVAAIGVDARSGSQWMIAVGASPPVDRSTSINGEVDLFVGSPGRTATLHTFSSGFPPPTSGALGDGFGLAITTGGDIDRDGFVDFLAGMPGIGVAGQARQGGLLPFLGNNRTELFDPLLHCDTMPSSCVMGGTSGGQRAGARLSAGFDINGDGYPDGCSVASGDGSTPVQVGCGNIVRPMNHLPLSVTGASSAANVVVVGDVTLSGYADILVFSGFASPSVTLFTGNATALAGTTMPPRYSLLPSPTAMGGFGGSIAYARVPRSPWAWAVSPAFALF